MHCNCLEVCLIQKVSLKTKQNKKKQNKKKKQKKKSSFKLASALSLSSDMLDTESVTENKTKIKTKKNKKKQKSYFKLTSRPIASLYYSCTFVRFHSEETTRNITSARRQKDLTGYWFKYIDRPFCLRTDELLRSTGYVRKNKFVYSRLRNPNKFSKMSNMQYAGVRMNPN